MGYRWGLYAGDDLYPTCAARTSQFSPAAVRPDADGILETCAGLPATPAATDYGPDLRQPQGVPDDHVQPR